MNGFQQQLSLADLQRVNVVGTSGSGKTTLGRELARLLNHPFVELDQLYWRPNWQEPNREEFLPVIESALNQPDWVVDGNYSSFETIKWKNVTAVVWVDFSFSRTICQAIKRAVTRAASQREIWPGTGNTESFRRTFLSTDSIVLWTLHSYWPVKKRYRSRMADPAYSHIKFIRLTNPRSTRRFLQLIGELQSDAAAKRSVPLT